MDDLHSQLKNLKSRYKVIFEHSLLDVETKIETLRSVDVLGDIFDFYEEYTSGRNWQDNVLKILNTDLKQSVNKKLFSMSEFRQNSKCAGCGICCRLAVSGYSPEQLNTKAQNNDNYAQQFTRTFIPYKNSGEARKIFPEYIDMLERHVKNGYYLYHCPKITDDNKCSDYENRPQICRDFPDNPLSFLPLSCGFIPWKLQSEDICLKLNAETEVIKFYILKIKDSQNQ